MKLATDNPSQKRMITISGKPKAGKTVTACTISDLAPAKLTPGVMTDLTDTVLIEFDMDGAESARQMGLNPYLFDLSKFNSANEVMKALSGALKEIEDEAKNGKIKYVILDPISTFDEIIATDKYREIPNSMAAAKLVKSVHMDLARHLRSITPTIVCTFHVKYLGSMTQDAAGEQQEKRAKANAISESAQFVSAMSGDNAAFFKKQASYNFVQYKTAKKGEPTKYTLLSESIYGYEAGGRDGGKLEAEETPHLNQLLRKMGYVK